MKRSMILLLGTLCVGLQAMEQNIEEEIKETINKIVEVPPLYQAIHDNDLQKVQDLLIAFGVDVTQQARGIPPLCAAVLGDNEKILKLLLEDDRFKSDVTTTEGVTPLLTGIYHKKLPLIQLLLNYKADPNLICTLVGKKGSKKLNALAFAVKRYDSTDVTYEIVRALIAAGAQWVQPQNLNAKEALQIIENCIAFFHAAIERHDNEAITFWLQVGIDANALNIINMTEKDQKNVLTPLGTAIKHNNYGAVKILLNSGAKVSAPVGVEGYDQPLHMAIDYNRDHIVELLAVVADVTALGNNKEKPLKRVQKSCNPLIMGMILDALQAWGENVRPSNIGESGLKTLLLCQSYNDEGTPWRAWLTQYSTWFSFLKKHPLLEDVLMYDCDGLRKKLAEQPQSLNAQDELGATILMYAAISGSVDTVKMLLVHGANVTLTTQHGYTVFDLLDGMIKRETDGTRQKQYQLIRNLCHEYAHNHVMRYIHRDAQSETGFTLPIPVSAHILSFMARAQVSELKLSPDDLWPHSLTGSHQALPAYKPVFKRNDIAPYVPPAAPAVPAVPAHVLPVIAAPLAAPHAGSKWLWPIIVSLVAINAYVWADDVYKYVNNDPLRSLPSHEFVAMMESMMQDKEYQAVVQHAQKYQDVITKLDSEQQQKVNDMVQQAEAALAQGEQVSPAV